MYRSTSSYVRIQVDGSLLRRWITWRYQNLSHVYIHNAARSSVVTYETHLRKSGTDRDIGDCKHYPSLDLKRKSVMVTSLQALIIAEFIHYLLSNFR
jgi:hypothetical protein